MNTRFASWGFFFLFVYGIYGMWSHRAAPHHQQQVEQQTAVAAPASSTPAPLMAEEGKLTGPSEKAETLNENPVGTQVSINLNEEAIQILEENIEDLRNQAYSVTSGDGWVVHMKENSVLGWLGIKDNDFVSYKNIQASEGSQGKTDLVQRVMSILNQIQK